MIMENLHDLVQRETEGRSKSKQSKVQIGYTVDTYNGVLEALQQLRIEMIEEGGGDASSFSSGSISTITNRWTMLGAMKIEGISGVSNDGFVIDANGQVDTFKQQQCVIKPYMPFCVDLTTTDGNSTAPHFAPLKSNYPSLDSGATLSCKVAFPPPAISADICDAAAVSLGSDSNDFIVGLGADLNSTVENFFLRCYPDIYKKGCAKQIAEKDALMAEVSIPHGDSAHLVNLKVTVDAAVGNVDGPHTVWFPTPLLLTDEFSVIGQKTTVGRGEQFTVGVGGCKSCFANSRYNHKNGTIKGFNPKFVKELVTKKDRVLAEAHCDLGGSTHNFKSGACYVRYYLDENKMAEVNEVFGTIPDKYKTELFKGVKTAKMGSENLIDYTGSSGATGAMTGDSHLENAFNNLISMMNPNQKLTYQQVMLAENEVTQHESGGAWDAWNHNDNGYGASIGRYQMNTNAGNVAEYLEVYKSLGGQVSDGFLRAASSKGNINPYETEFRQQANTAIGKQAQVKVFYEGDKGKRLLRYYNELKCKTAIEFCSLMAGLNHGPGAMSTSCNFFRNEILAVSSDDRKRAEYIEKCHMIASGLMNYYHSNRGGADNGSYNDNAYNNFCREVFKTTDKKTILENVTVNTKFVKDWSGERLARRHSKILERIAKGQLNSW